MDPFESRKLKTLKKDHWVTTHEKFSQTLNEKQNVYYSYYYCYTTNIYSRSCFENDIILFIMIYQPMSNHETYWYLHSLLYNHCSLYILVIIRFSMNFGHSINLKIYIATFKMVGYICFQLIFATRFHL